MLVHLGGVVILRRPHGFTVFIINIASGEALDGEKSRQKSA